MIFARDKGRMCNNMLQYGHVYAWAREHGRKSVSMRFCYKYQYFNICSTRHHNFFTYIVAKYVAKLGLMPVVTFDEESDDTAEKERTMLSATNVMVEGWYVRYYDLFLKYKQDIVCLFSFKKNIRDKVLSYMAATTSQDGLKLGVHIRRGDYKTWKGGMYYFDDETYIAYIQKFAGQFAGRRIDVCICGNDPLLDHQKYADRLKGRISVHFPAGNPAEDLCLLSECDYIMGAPSTFSLVASMYHDRPLLWMEKRQPDEGRLDFRKFDCLFRNIK